MTLLPRFKKLPVKRVVALNNITGDTRLSVSYDDAGTGLMPAGTPSAEIAAFLISGMEDVAAKYNATGKVNFRLFPFTTGSEWPFAIQMGSMLNHTAAQMSHKLAHQAAFHQHSIGAPLSNPLLKRCLDFTREPCEGSQRATLTLT